MKKCDILPFKIRMSQVLSERIELHKSEKKTNHIHGWPQSECMLITLTPIHFYCRVGTCDYSCSNVNLVALQIFLSAGNIERDVLCS